ncbi:DUF4229 domain-containing protein [Pseudonocardia humida]|uniref:DUF4229 domain-containing protein n=1 Tax=Pseudonocardia humida TaxID=2800819 RepID=A0ABT1A1F4_9PSEU|nr:DUF4229 domain-containing protein [Pseudonocardia humida]MCO1656750.1 DUF4229 domain-containing protein [Pseudonocardia humida]
MATSPAPTRPGLGPTIALYALARLGLLALIALALVLAGVPALIAVLVALIVALPLSMVLFRGLRARLDEALSVAKQRRAVEREALRSRLRGDEPPADAQPDPEVRHVARAEPAPSDVAAPDQPDRRQD